MKDHISFNEEGSCVEGGLYFTTSEFICDYLHYGNILVEIFLPEDNNDFKMVKDPDDDKWRANMIEIRSFD